jgi:CheY-like chemotaxis protein
LIADDEESVGVLIAFVLTSRGYDPVVTTNGAAALASAQEPSRKFDLLITDVDMPRMSGVELAARFIQRHAGVPVLFISGGANLGIAYDFVSAHRRAALLKKPFSPAQLLQMVAALLDGRASGASASQPQHELAVAGNDHTTGPLRLRIVLADDHDEARSLLTQLLSVSYDVVRAVASGREALQAAKELHPDIALLDISMPGLSGFAVARALQREAPDIKIVFVTQHGEKAYLSEALRSGASGYVLKGRVSTDLGAALQSVTAGIPYGLPAA